jgi:hypothetical protein
VGDPLTAFIAWLGSTVFSGSSFGAFLIMYGQEIAYIALAAGSIAAGRAQQRRMERKQRDAFNSTIQDRSIMIRAAAAPSPWIVGRAVVSGPIVFATTTGALKEYLHMVIAFCRHECDAIEAVYLNDYELPAENGGTGLVNTGTYAPQKTFNKFESLTANGSGVVTMSASIVNAIVSIVVQWTGAAMDNPNTPVGAYTWFAPANTISGLTPGTVYDITYDAVDTTALVKIRKHLGAAGQVADADLVADSGGLWTSTDKGTGICYLYIRLQFNQDIFGSIGLPNVKARLRGIRLWDPRTSTTVWSTNAALAAAAYLKDQTFGIRAVSAEVPDAELITSSNIADEDVTIFNTGTVAVVSGSPNITFSSANVKKFVRPNMTLIVGANRAKIQSINLGAGGNTAVLATNYAGSTNAAAAFSVVQTRYEVNGALTSANTPWDNLEEILKSMAGSCVWVQGRWLLRAGAHVTPVMTITEDYLSEDPIQIVPRKGRKNLFNGAAGHFSNVMIGYSDDEYPIYAPTAYATEDGEQILAAINYDLVVDGTACQRLGKIEVLRSRQAMIVSLSTNLRGYELAPSDTVMLTLARYGWAAKIFYVLERNYALDRKIEYVLQETSSTVWDWSTSDATAIDYAPNTGLPSANTPPARLLGLTVAAGTAQLLRNNDGSIVSRALVSWTQSTDIFVTQGGYIEAQWKPLSNPSWMEAGKFPGDQTSFYINGVPDGLYITVQVRQVTGTSKASEWASFTVQVVGKTAAPSNVTNLGYEYLSTGVRIFWDDAPDPDYDETELRIGASWAAGAFLGRVKGRQFNWLNPPKGTYTVWAAHYDTSGNVSVTPLSLSVTVGAGGDEVWVAHGVAGLNVRVNSVEKATGSNAWDAGVYSAQSAYGACEVSYTTRFNNKDFMFGLNTDPTTDANYASIDYALYFTASGVIQVYENGVQIISSGGAYSAGARGRVLYDGVAIHYYVNGTLIYEHGAPAGLFLYADSSFFTVGAVAENLSFSALTPIPQGNLIDSSTWLLANPIASSQVGTSGGALFGLNQDNANENAIIMASAPDGVLRPVWKAGPSIGGIGVGADGGWDGGAVPINSLKTYRWALWMKVVTLTSGGSFYLGCQPSTVAAIPTGVTDSNPYFTVVSPSNFVLGRWYLVIGFVLPSNFGTTPPSPTAGGVYDGVTGERVDGVGADFKWVVGNPTSSLRAYQYYTTAGAVMHFWAPRLEMCNGSEPTIKELLAPALESKSIVYDNAFDAAYGLNGSFNRWPFTSTYPTGWSLWGNAGVISKETTTFADGPNAIRMSPATSSDTGVLWLTDFNSKAKLPLGAYVEITISAYVVNHVSGVAPGALLRLFYNSALTNVRDKTIVFDRSAGGWQTITANVAVQAGETIWGIEIFLMASWTGLGGAWNGTVIYDKVEATVKQPKDTTQIISGAATANAAAAGTSTALTVTTGVVVAQTLDFVTGLVKSVATSWIDWGASGTVALVFKNTFGGPPAGNYDVYYWFTIELYDVTASAVLDTIDVSELRSEYCDALDIKMMGFSAQKTTLVSSALPRTLKVRMNVQVMKIQPRPNAVGGVVDAISSAGVTWDSAINERKV